MAEQFAAPAEAIFRECATLEAKDSCKGQRAPVPCWSQRKQTEGVYSTCLAI